MVHGQQLGVKLGAAEKKNFDFFFYIVLKRRFNTDTSPQNFQHIFLGPRFLEKYVAEF